MAIISNAELKLKQSMLSAINDARRKIISGDYTGAAMQLKTVTDCLEVAETHKAERIPAETVKTRTV